MPYKLRGNCVVKADGTTVKCHATRAKALAHLKALEANVADAQKAVTVNLAGAGVLANLFKSLADLFGASDAGTRTGGAVEKADPSEFYQFVPISKIDVEKRIVYGVVYEPDVHDAHDDFMTADDIEKAAHQFLSDYSLAKAQTGTDHAALVDRQKMIVVESYIAPQDMKLGEQDVSKGTWVMGAHVADPKLWNAVKSGRFTGWSLEGFGVRTPV